MPVLMIATYGENDKVDVMNMAWGGVCASNMVALNIDEDHKTTQNIKERMAFTLSVADIDHLEESDFFGIASGNKMEDKFERTGMHAVRSDKVDAPVIEEYPADPGVQGGRAGEHRLRLPRPGRDCQRPGRREGAGREGQGRPDQAQRLYL